MPTAPVNDIEAVVYYEDTGAPDDRDSYLTIVLVHGLTFHGGKSLDRIAKSETKLDLIGS